METQSKNPPMLRSRTFLTDEEVNYYYNLVSSKQFPWYFSPATGIGYDDSHFDTKDVECFTHIALNHGQNNEPILQEMVELFKKFANIEGIEYSEVHRVRLNAFLSNPDPKPTGAHVDMLEDHKVFVYYFNDADGGTQFYKERAEDSHIPQSLTPDIIIRPKAGLGLVFDGKIFHSPIPPKDTQVRFSLNFDFR